VRTVHREAAIAIDDLLVEHDGRDPRKADRGVGRRVIDHGDRRLIGRRVMIPLPMVVEPAGGCPTCAVHVASMFVAENVPAGKDALAFWTVAVAVSVPAGSMPTTVVSVPVDSRVPTVRLANELLGLATVETGVGPAVRPSAFTLAPYAFSVAALATPGCWRKSTPALAKAVTPSAFLVNLRI
jgi:hypothetical protein